jgi:hypothetical protein
MERIDGETQTTRMEYELYDTRDEASEGASDGQRGDRRNRGCWRGGRSLSLVAPHGSLIK